MKEGNIFEFRGILQNEFMNYTTKQGNKEYKRNRVKIQLTPKTYVYASIFAYTDNNSLISFLKLNKTTEFAGTHIKCVGHISSITIYNEHPAISINIATIEEIEASPIKNENMF